MKPVVHLCELANQPGRYSKSQLEAIATFYGWAEIKNSNQGQIYRMKDGNWLEVTYGQLMGAFHITAPMGGRS